ncbi:hypothetical protein, partial [Aquabacterium sp.]|uniref:hypothetical protein n=1 Tax=Aquabacterium sp. TaxID=1872578 RepID=UPI0025B82725
APLVGVHIPDGAVVYNMEPLYDGCRSFSLGYMDTLKRCRVLDYSRPNVDYLKRHGVDAFYLPYGYHQSLERTPAREKRFDFLLVGSVNPRRAQMVNELRRFFEVLWVTGAYGNALDELVAMSRVCLNIHFIPDHPLEVARLNYLMANHCTVVTEPGNDEVLNSAYAPGVHMGVDIVAACAEALSRPRDGYECIRSIPMDLTGAKDWLTR